MRIPVNRGGGAGRRFARLLFNLPVLILLAVVGGLVGGALAVGIIVGARLEENGNGDYVRFLTQSDLATEVVVPGMRMVREWSRGSNVPVNVWKGLTADLERVVIDIEHLDYQRLAFKRAQALELGVLFSSSADYVPATVTVGGKSARAKIRLKGDLPDHFESDKWSLRIALKDDETLFGMSTFSIQRPEARNDITEWLFLEALRREGVLAVRYRFVDVTINGVHKGIYALEEHFEKHLIEAAGLREGPIVKFDEDLRWREVVANSPELEIGSVHSAAIVPFDEGPGYRAAVSLLEEFRRGRKPTTVVFDARKLASFLAIRELCGAFSAQWPNLRFYHNPVTSKLEPIGFDCEASEYDPIDRLFCYDGGTMDKTSWHVQSEDDPLKMVFRDPGFFAHYVQALERVSAPDYLDRLYAEVDEELQGQLGVLYREYPYLSLSDEAFRKNQAFIRAALRPEKAIHAWFLGLDRGRVRIAVGNLQSFPVQIVGLASGADGVTRPDEPVLLPSKRHKQPVDQIEVGFSPQDGMAGLGEDRWKLSYRLLGSDEVRTVEVYPWAPILEGAGDWVDNPSPIDRLDFLAVREDSSTIAFRPGRHLIDETLVFPPGYTVLAGPGTQIDLRRGARIVSYSALNFRGSGDDPVLVESSDSTGQGVLVLNADRLSEIEHVAFDNLGWMNVGDWEVPGAVTFYESEVRLRDVQFREARSEDALNIIRTSFKMERVTFLDSQSDAFDGDFVSGSIKQSGFLRSGNDAIDVSGSVIELIDVRVNGAQDKAVSAGERSEMTVRGLEIEDAELAITSKDLSSIVGSTITISDCRVAFCIFQKKSEYGQASVAVTDVTMSGIEKPFLIERGSFLSLDEEVVEFTHESLDELLYGAVYGKASK